MHGMDVAGAFVCHRCDNPRCVRPSHLFIGDAAANNADMRSKGREGHGFACVYGEANAASKLTTEKVSAIRAMAADGIEQRAIAVLFGVSQSAVSLIVSRRRWSHI